MEYINFLGDLFMVRINYLVHLISGILYAVLGVFLLLPAMFISFLSLIFNGNLIGLIMIIMSAFILYTAYLCFRNGIKDPKIYNTDPELYKSNEIKTSIFSILSALIILLLLLVFNQSISDVIKYGFGMFLAAGAVLLIGNLISLGLTLKMQSSRS